ncbi:MAG: SCP-like extracellular [Caulobacteraceae bacterium]|nr:SCP-like extracellular [Caulobacteraceae bacterium]
MRKTMWAVLGLGMMLAAPGVGRAGDFEDQVMQEINRARADPAGFARELRRERAQSGVQADERRDPRAFSEAIDFLMRQRPLPPLESDHRLAAAAQDLARAQGPTGNIGHGGGGGLGKRIQSRGVWAGTSAETISYGQPTPREVVAQLVVDFGVPDRGHRDVIFDRGFEAAGVGCGRHATYGKMCVIDFAGAFPPRN